ncbi:MAG TPA: hypothetical protein VFU48_06850 [Nitrospira sp.]|nr:hypothetical protein [Nitrospira sp.]
MNFSGFIAWWLRRTSYSLKLPQFEKKLLVTLDWTLDVLFSKDPVHFRTKRSRIPTCGGRIEEICLNPSRLASSTADQTSDYRQTEDEASPGPSMRLAP